MLFALLCILMLPSQLCSDCSEFTVGNCGPKSEKAFLSFECFPDNKKRFNLCEDMCNNAEDCLYWSLLCGETVLQPCTCSLYPYSYLHSCNVTGGTSSSDIEVSPTNLLLAGLANLCAASLVINWPNHAGLHY